MAKVRKPEYPPLPRTFYDRDVVVVARALLGKILVRTMPEGRTAGRIVEVEAYLGAEDPASHSFRGATRRNASMFGPPGHAYVYAIHSRWCMNVVTETAGVGSAVLLRAVEPLEGIELMRARRLRRQARDAQRGKRGAPRRRKRGPALSVRDLARGPARLCEAFAVDRRLDGWDLTGGETLWIAESWSLASASGSAGEPIIVTTPRVGVTSAHHLPLRFLLADSPFVSRPRMR